MPNRTIVDSATATAVSSVTLLPLPPTIASPGCAPVGTASSRPVRSRAAGLLLEQLRLVGAGHLRREVDVTGQAAVAAHRVRLAGHRVLEDRGGELLRGGLLAAGGQRHGPVDGEPGVVV